MSNTDPKRQDAQGRTFCLVLGVLLALSLILPWIQGTQSYLGFQWFLTALTGGAEGEDRGAMWVSDARATFPPVVMVTLVGVVLWMVAVVSCARDRDGALGLRNRVLCILGSVLAVPMITIMLDTHRKGESAFYAVGWYLTCALAIGFLVLGIFAPRRPAPTARSAR